MSQLIVAIALQSLPFGQHNTDFPLFITWHVESFAQQKFPGKFPPLHCVYVEFSHVRPSRGNRSGVRAATRAISIAMTVEILGERRHIAISCIEAIRGIFDRKEFVWLDITGEKGEQNGDLGLCRKRNTQEHTGHPRTKEEARYWTEYQRILTKRV